MDDIKFEDLLGKHISVAKDFTGSDFKASNYGSKFYGNSRRSNGGSTTFQYP